MFSDPNFFWKNFRLGSELQISGTFIYNALYFFDKMEHFHYEGECFEFLYNVSVGLERLEKIAIVLLEHENIENQEDFEKSLITHNHLDLLNRIKSKKQLNLSTIHNKFLQLISDFYKSMRYNRFTISSVYEPDQDKNRLINFIEEGLNIKIETKFIFPTQNDKRIKKFIGKIIGKITSEIYDLISNESFRLNLATYETAYASKAFKIFIEREFTFEKEKLLQKEILVYLLNYKYDNALFHFIKDIEPLPFDENIPNEYIKYLINIHNNRDILDEFEYFYQEKLINKEREEEIDAIGNENVTFNSYDIDGFDNFED